MKSIGNMKCMVYKEGIGNMKGMVNREVLEI